MLAATSCAPVADLESELLGLWNKFLNRSDLTIDDDFFESGGDSLMATELLAEVERLVQDSISPSILFETGTVRQLVERLTGQIAPQLGVKIGGEKGRIFHFFHGDFNYGGSAVRQLETMLGPNRPIMAIAPHGMDGERLPASIEEMAAERLPLILESQPHGPYVLGGHCNGALVAFETSRLLVKAGHTVDLLVMLDPLVVGRLAQHLLGVLDFVQRAVGFSEDQRLNSRALAWTKLVRTGQAFRKGVAQKRGLAKQWNRNLRRLGLAPAVQTTGPKNPTRSRTPKTPPLTPSQFERLGAYARVMSAYCPSRLDVPILFVALSYGGRGWGRISSQIEFMDAPGQHNPGPSTWDHVREHLDALDA